MQNIIALLGKALELGVLKIGLERGGSAQIQCAVLVQKTQNFGAFPDFPLVGPAIALYTGRL